MLKEELYKEMHGLVDQTLLEQKEGESFLTTFVALYFRWMSDVYGKDSVQKEDRV